ncbi:choice-of-anchor G family protein, partial [Arthrobacter sp. SW1]|uniref:choice-of-anchor G family protein n=1 Tax=Arthrobacter sp. SW1 TaxID=1920889 RepID=UPI000AFC7702
MADVNTQPAQQSESAASIIDTSILGQELAGGGQTRALFPGGPLSDQGGLDLSLLGSEVIDLGGIPIPLSELIDFGQLGVLNSQSQTTDAKNARAISGIAGADGAVTLDGADGDFGAARINLLSLFEKAGIAGATDLLIDEATLLAGAGGAQVIAQNGEFLDPDGFGGKGQYRVAEASLLLHSPTIEQIASDLYDQLGQVDQTMEDTVNGMLDLTALASALPGVTLDASVESNMRDQIFQAILAQPITTNNQVLTVDFSTGNMTIQLDQIYSGERPEGPDAPDGINNQAPNTEVIDDTIYPIIAETVHDLMEEVTNIAVGAIAGALGSVTLNITAGMTTPLGGAVATTSINLMGDLGQIQCTPSGLGGAGVCATLTTMLTAAQPILTTMVQPIRDFILSDGGQQIFDTLIGGIKTGAITLPIRMLLSPFFDVLTQAISLQLNRQVETTCLAPDGTTKTASLEVSALSLGLAQAVDGARLNLGSAGVRIGACAAAISPAITLDPTQVPAGGTTNVDGTGFTPNGDVQIQLLDPNGNPVCTPVTVPADANGAFTADLPICPDIAPGNYTVRATDVTTNTPVTAPLEVLQPNVQELNIGLDPPTVPAGDPTNATGSGYTPNGPVTVQLLDPAGNPVGNPIPTTADANGGFTVPVPTPADAAPGTYTVRGTDNTTNNSADAPLTVVEPGSPVLTVDPASVPAGEPTNATGTDYTPNGPVTVQLLDPAGNPVGAPIPTTADANGGFTVPVPTPADAAPGDYTVRGTDNTTNEAPTAPLTVTEPAAAPSIVADPSSVPAGDPTNAIGSGYTPNGPVTVQLLDPAGNPVGAPIPTTADANGGFTVPVPTPADAAPGDYTVRGTDNTTNEAPTAPLTIVAPDAPIITVDPSSVPAGDPTNATGANYTPNGPVTVQLLDPAGNPVGNPIPTTADANGGFTVPVPTPADAAPGDYTVRGTDNTTNEAPTAPL